VFVRKLQRELTWLALAACVPLVSGCATTQNYLVDPASASRETVASVKARGDHSVEFAQPPPAGMTARFSGHGGAIDTTTMTIRGTGSTGQVTEVPLAEAGSFRILATADGRETVEVSADALIAGPAWRPDGGIQRITLQSGAVIDARRAGAVVDARRGAVLLAAAGEDTTVVPFGEIRYLRIKDTHPGRSALCFLGVVGLGLAVAFAISMSGWSSN